MSPSVKEKLNPLQGKLDSITSMNNGASLGFEEKLWKAADKMRNNIDAAEYKHVVLGLTFLKYISDSFEERYKELVAEKEQGADPEDKDEYMGYNVFWVPKEARWSVLQGAAKQPTIGAIIDNAMIAIENQNASLKGVLPKEYARPSLDKDRLGQLIDLIGTIGLGDSSNRSKDILGRVYEYFLGQFASAEGKNAGQFYTPRSVVRLLVEMIEPFNGRVYDPCCGSGGMFVQSEKFVESHGGHIGDISIYGQESNPTTWKLCKMNLAIRSIDGNIGQQHADTFKNDVHKDLKADFILANPPFNDSDWNGELFREDIRWKFGVPRPNNANYAWVQHIIYHLSPNGTAGFVLSNGSLSSTISNDAEIRKAIVEADLVDCIVALPGNLFYSTSIAACLWFLTRDKRNPRFRDRRGEILLIDARSTGILVDKTHRVLNDIDIMGISKIYHSWRSTRSAEKYIDVAGLSKSVTVKEVASQGYALSPNRYVGLRNSYADSEGYVKRINPLVNRYREQLSNTVLLGTEIKKNIDRMFCYEYIDKTSVLRIIDSNNSKGLELFLEILFKSWFVDFNFPNDEDKPYKSGGGKLIDSELGDIPTGWKVMTMSEAAYVIDCLHAKKPKEVPRGRTILQVFNITKDNKIDLVAHYRISEEDYKLWTSRIEVSTGDCVITNVGRVGAIAQIPEGLKAAIGRNMTAIRCRPTILKPTYLFLYLLSSYMEDEIKLQTDTGTILDSLNVKGIVKLRILIPPLNILNKFETVSRPIRRQIEVSDEQSRILEELKHYLRLRVIPEKTFMSDQEPLVDSS